MDNKLLYLILKLDEPLQIVTVNINNGSETVRARLSLGEALGRIIKNPTKRIDHSAKGLF